MPSEKYSAGKRHGQKIVVRALIAEDTYEALKKFAPAYEERWESTLLRRIIHEWLEAQKNKGDK